jgi:hypothetical protein
LANAVTSSIFTKLSFNIRLLAWLQIAATPKNILLRIAPIEITQRGRERQEVF